MFLVVEVTVQAGVQEALDKAVGYLGKDVPLAGAVLCSGIVLAPGDLEGYGPDKRLTSYRQLKHLVEVNLLGTYNVAQRVAEIMIGNEPLNEDGSFLFYYIAYSI